MTSERYASAWSPSDDEPIPFVPTGKARNVNVRNNDPLIYQEWNPTIDPQSTLVCQHPPIFRDYKRSRCRLCAEKVETTE